MSVELPAWLDEIFWMGKADETNSFGEVFGRYRHHESRYSCTVLQLPVQV